jgi:hypothetical protein
MQFVWQQVQQWLFPVDQVSLRVSSRFIAFVIPMSKIYKEANKLILAELKKSIFRNLNMENIFNQKHNQFLYGSFFATCLFGTQMSIHYDYTLVLCFANQDLPAQDYFAFHNIHYEDFTGYTPFAFISQRANLDFNRILFNGKDLYVGNWNALIERSCDFDHIDNSENNFRCLRSAIPYIMREIYDYRDCGFRINIDNQEVFNKQDYCIHCRFKRFSFCVDRQEEHDFDCYWCEDSDSERDTSNEIEETKCFERLTKIQRKKKFILNKKQKLQQQMKNKSIIAR